MAGLAIEPITGKVESRVDRRAVLIGALVVAAVTLLFFSTFFNRFAGLRSGNGSFSAGVAWLQGKLPYRDYFCTATPLNLIKSAAVVAAFGERLFVVRAFALFERSVLALVLYFWLARFFRASHAAMAAILAIVVSAGDVSDPLSSYNHDTILWAVLSGFLASLALDKSSTRQTALFAGLSGVCAGLCFSTKQTIGLGMVVAIPVICGIFISRLDGVRKAAIFVASFAVGCILPLAALYAWLVRLGIANDFIQQAFVRGPAAKALGGNQFLARTILVATRMWPAVVPGIAACFLSWRAVIRSSAQPEDRGADAPQRLIPILVSAAIAVAAGFALSRAGFNTLPILPKASIYFVLLACPVIGFYYGWLFLRNIVSRRRSQYCLLAGVSFVTASMLSLSWPAFEAMVMPGLGFLTAAVLDGSPRWRRWILWGLCPLILFTQTSAKLNSPHGFADWFDPPVREATMRSALPEMSGMVLPPGVVRLIDGTVQIIRENTTPQDTIFVYPEMSLFYSLTDRVQATFSGSHNIDVVNDTFAKEEAARLLQKRPKVIVYYREPDDYLAGEELIWRQGKPSGQRDIIAAIETLIKDYRLAETFPSPKNARTVLVFVRP
jgi:hypothetical protein